MFHQQTRFWLIASVAALLVSMSTTSLANEEQGAEVRPETIDEWIMQLDHERLTKRQEARRHLLQAGKLAIPALAKAALSGKREMIDKSIDILGKLTQSEDEQAQEAARITLQMLSESDQPSTAERAKLALNTQEADGIQPFEGWNKPGNEFAQRGGGRNRSVSVTNINGIRTINVKDSGLDTTIQEQPGGGIQVRITGGEEPIELTAKDADDLKEQHPEAFAIYDEYTRGNGPVAGLGQFGGNAMGPPPIFGANQNAFGNAAAGQQAFAFRNDFQAADAKSRQMLVEQLQELKQRMGDNPMMQQMLDQQIKMVVNDDEVAND